MTHTNKPNNSPRAKTSAAPKAPKIPKAPKTVKIVNNKSATRRTYFYLAEPPIKKQTPCYIPLCLGSQSGHSHVLYYNANAPADEIFDCATGRIHAVAELMECLIEFSTAEKNAIPAVANVSAYLLNDAMTLLQELNPIAIQLKAKTNNTNSD